MSESLFLLSGAAALGILGFGFLLGLKHATDADHLAAVGTIVAERKSPWSSAVIGVVWGLGHTISLLLAGVFVLLLNFEISGRAERLLELGVGLMLALLGLNVLRKLLRGGHFHFHVHEHEGHVHAHPHIHEKDQADRPHTHHGLSFSPRALVIGMIHGLAGSAGLMLLIIPTIESQTIGLLYVLIFGVGSIAGMMLMSFLVSLPFHLTASRFNRFHRLLQAAAGLASIVLGIFIIYEKGFAEGAGL